MVLTSLLSNFSLTHLVIFLDAFELKDFDRGSVVFRQLETLLPKLLLADTSLFRVSFADGLNHFVILFDYLFLSFPVVLVVELGYGEVEAVLAVPEHIETRLHPVHVGVEPVEVLFKQPFCLRVDPRIC